MAHFSNLVSVYLCDNHHGEQPTPILSCNPHNKHNFIPLYRLEYWTMTKYTYLENRNIALGTLLTVQVHLPLLGSEINNKKIK